MALLEQEGKTENETTTKTKGMDADVVQIGDYTFQVIIDIVKDDDGSFFIIRATEITTKDVFEFKRDEKALLTMNWPNSSMQSVKQFITSTIFDADIEMTVNFGFIHHKEQDDDEKQDEESLELLKVYEEGDDMVITIALEYKWMKSNWRLDLKYIPQDEVKRLKVLVKDLREELKSVKHESNMRANQLADDSRKELKSVKDELNLKTKQLREIESFKNGFKGMIVMWSGNVAHIPKGWALCDGRNGTPNLRDRFILGNNGNNIGSKGGSKTHSHTITVNGHTLNISQIPSHTHNMQFSYATNIKWASDTGRVVSLKNDFWEQQRYQHTESSGGNQPHSHGASSNSRDHMPPYYVLGFIMKL